MKRIILISIVTIALSSALWLIWWKLFRDGIGSTGYYDDEGGTPQNDIMTTDNYLTYEQQPIALRYFDISEFDSPDEPGSGKNMKVKFLQMIDETRHRSGIPFDVTPPGGSGYRTKAHNKAIGGVGDSAHTKGWAADVIARTRSAQIKIVRAAREVGFNRFGIYGTWIHIDCDPSKQQNVAWNKKLEAVKKGGDFRKFPFDPFTV